MEKKHIIETIGTIEKKEILTTIGYDDLVLESLHPFPGYHGTTIPDEDKPKSVFFMIKGNFSEEIIIRTIQQVKKVTDIEFDATPAFVTLHNEMAPSIRIRDIKKYDVIPDLLRLFRNAGISFQSGKKIEPYEGLIKVKKYFLLDPITDCTLQDMEVPAMKYFQLPLKLEWNQFEQITLHIKRNMEDANFDAALATIYRKAGLIDYIRIYEDVDCSLEKLNQIRKRYIQEIKKIV
ncbi:MAG: hypothetical protein KKA81_07515 [Bacteroidetes bacterium]|nr:hypothetical protein [Bacteroidota bacterium]